MTRAKFKVLQVVKREQWVNSGSTGSHEIGYEIEMYPVISGSPENEQFYKLTPGGNMKLTVLSEETANQFEIGKEYYVDFTKAE